MTTQFLKPDASTDVRRSAWLNRVTKTFVTRGTAVDAVKDIVLDVTPGEYVVILGPSGCGKSTLIRCIAGLESPTQGAIQLNDKTVYDAKTSVDLKPNAREVGMVFQSYALWPHMTVEQNVGYPLRMRKVPRAEIKSRVETVLIALECEQLAQRLPVELSGGQQQRIALARALVYEPAILLLDEPLSNLDALLRVSLRTELLRLHRKLGFTALHITHDQEEALEMGDRVVLMREGRIEQMGPPEEVYARPVSPYAAVFLGLRNQLSGRVVRGEFVAEDATVRGSGAIVKSFAEDTELKLFTRGRDVHVFKRGDIPGPESGLGETIQLDGTLAQIVLGEGGRRQCILDIGGVEWFAQHSVEDLKPGDSVTVAVAAAQALVYQGETLVYPPK